MPKKNQSEEKEQGDWKRVAECLYIYKPSGTYYGLVKKSGKQTRRSLKTQDRTLANRALKKLRSNVGNLSPDAADRRIKFDPLAKRWLSAANTGLKDSTARRNALCVKTLTGSLEFKGKPLSSISRRNCENWASNRAKGISARTYNYDLQVLKRILTYAVETGVTLSNPAATLKPHKEAPKGITVPTRKEFETLLETLETMRKRDARTRHAVELVKLLAFSGMRLNEATSITWSEIDLDRGVFTVSGGEKGTKNGEIRNVPLFPKLRLFLEELREKRSKNAFDSISGAETVISTKTARTAIESACKTARLPKFDHHCMRHFFASNAIENGIDFKTIAAWLGHKDGGLLVAKTYGHLRDTHSHEMAKLMK